ncbi:MAG TPA: hypothetical protein VIZ28_06630 [Chitinophagaceae bacterium]
MQLYYDLIEKVPEFKDYDVMGEEHYIETGISPLGSIGFWLKDLVCSKKEKDTLIRKICNYLNEVYKNANNFTTDIRNDFQVYLFWVLDYQTIEYIKPYLDQQILVEGREYLKAIDGENYRDF